MLDILVASNNEHKIKEFKNIFAPLGINVYSPKDLNIVGEPLENGKTFEENSLIKANFYKDKTTMPVLADDSGLCVEALNGFPGIYSARFAKESNGNKNANKRIIELLNKHSNKDAEFVCLITVINLEENPLIFKGICNGKILDEPIGNNGFGYDPIFYSYEANLPFGECDENIKNTYSHRAKALNLFISYLKDKNLIY